MWTIEVDETLKKLYDEAQLHKWSLIADKINEEFNSIKRNNRQCRDRYHNYIDPNFIKESWTSEEEKKLYRLHDEMGNKWAIIATIMRGRTDNSVKNHFFSKLRKSLRKMNKVIQEKYKKEIKEIKYNVLYKIIEASQEKFKPEPMCEDDIIQYACKLKNKILSFADQDDNEEDMTDQNDTKELIQAIIDFNKEYKRKPKKLRRLATNSDFLAVPKTFMKRSSSGSNSSFQIFQDEDDKSETSLNSDEDEIKRPKKIETSITSSSETGQQRFITPIILSQCNIDFYQKMMDEKEDKHQYHELEIEKMLASTGVLEDELPLPPHPSMMKKKTSFVSLMQQEESEEYHLFFEDSEMHMRILEPLLLHKASEEGLFH